MKTIYITEEQKNRILIAEKKRRKKPISAQDQVGNKVNAGIMDGLVGGMCAMEENSNPTESDKYSMGPEEGSTELNAYFHINEEKDNENDIREYCHKIEEFMEKEGLKVKPFPKLNLDWSEQDGLFIRTGFYTPEEKAVTVFCNDRHIKDILRSFAHEMIHHMQNLEGVNLNFTSEDDVKDNKELEKIESEAYLKGNIYFRKWTEYENSKDKDVLQESKGKQIRNEDGEIVPDYCECGGKIGTYICGEPIYKCSECGKYYGVVKFTLNKKNLSENLIYSDDVEETIEPDDVDLSSFNIKKDLNPKFWKNNLLDSRIRLKLLDIADDFIDFLGVDWVKPDDIIITGSLANYNWSKKYSDIDLHVLIDYSKVDEKVDFVKKYFDSLKNLWNEEHEGLNIYGFPVEVYVQDTNEPHASTGVYSLDKNAWVVEPERKKLATAKVNKQFIREKVAYYVNKIDDLIDYYENNKNDEYKINKISIKIDELLEKIRNERKNSLKDIKSEISNGNIIYKTLRRTGYLDKIYDLKTKIYDKSNSL